MLEAKANVNQARTSDGYTPLLMACSLGHSNVVRLLFNNGVIASTALLHVCIQYKQKAVFGCVLGQLLSSSSTAALSQVEHEVKTASNQRGSYNDDLQGVFASYKHKPTGTLRAVETQSTAFTDHPQWQHMKPANAVSICGSGVYSSQMELPTNFHDRYMSSRQLLGRGAFGEVYQVQLCDIDIVVKVRVSGMWC